jgi:hypothetical protein
VDVINVQTDGFALKSNVRQIIEIDTDIAIIQKTDIDLKNIFKKIDTDIDLKNRHRPSSNGYPISKVLSFVGRLVFLSGNYSSLENTELNQVTYSSN